jgi:hypothetical protein
VARVDDAVLLERREHPGIFDTRRVEAVEQSWERCAQVDASAARRADGECTSEFVTDCGLVVVIRQAASGPAGVIVSVVVTHPAAPPPKHRLPPFGR